MGHPQLEMMHKEIAKGGPPAQHPGTPLPG